MWSSTGDHGVKGLLILCLIASVALAEGEVPNGNVKVEEGKDPVAGKVCDACNCTVDTIDCSSRNLTTTLYHYEWPKQPLKLVNFENNHITEVQPFPNISIYKLIFRNNQISKVDHAAFRELKNLTELDLSWNQLNRTNFLPMSLEGKFAPNALEPLPNLRILDLSHNQFRSLNQDLFEHVKDLKILRISNNPFVKLDEGTTQAMNELYYLEELDLSECGLKGLSETAFHLITELKKLNLSNNRFDKVPSALDETHNLETLILDGNPIEMLNRVSSFPPMKGLKHLSMRNMTKLLSIDAGALGNLENLETLVVEDCPLFMMLGEEALVKQPDKDAEGGIATWPPLKTLNITNNNLRYLPSGLLARWDMLEHLHMTGNPWSCDCDNDYLIEQLVPDFGHKLMGNDTYKLTCHAPPEHLNKTLPSLSNRHLRCLDKNGARPERDAAVLVGMLVGVLLAVPVVLVMFVMWRRGFVCCGGTGAAGYTRAFYKRAPPYEYDI